MSIILDTSAEDLSESQHSEKGLSDSFLVGALYFYINAKCVCLRLGGRIKDSQERQTTCLRPRNLMTLDASSVNHSANCFLLQSKLLHSSPMVDIFTQNYPLFMSLKIRTNSLFLSSNNIPSAIRHYLFIKEEVHNFKKFIKSVSYSNFLLTALSTNTNSSSNRVSNRRVYIVARNFWALLSSIQLKTFDLLIFKKRNESVQVLIKFFLHLCCYRK